MRWSPGHIPRRSVREVGLVAATGLGMAAMFLVVKGSLIDDAYITLSYVRNMALDLHWGIIPGEVANSATSPLNVVLLSLVTAVTRIGGEAQPVLAVGLVSVALAMTMAWGWIRIVRALQLPVAVAALGVAVVLLNPFLLSSVGLEVLLSATLLTALVALALEERPFLFAIAAGLTLLTRLDLIVLVLAIGVAAPAIRQHWVRVPAVSTAVAAPWFAFSWVYFGSAVPDTLLIKASQVRPFGDWTYLTGPVMYLLRQPTLVALAVVPALMGLFGLVGWLALRTSVRWSGSDRLPRLGPATGLGVGGIGYVLVYALLGVGPYHWYYVTPLTALSAFLVIAAGVWLCESRARPRLRAAAPAVVLSTAGCLALGNLAMSLKEGVPWRSAIIHTNWATAEEYADIGVALRGRIGSATVESPGEIGTLAYFCECSIVDDFSDPGRAVEKVDEVTASAGFVNELVLDLNYLWLDRDQRPRDVAYTLRHEPGPGSGPDVWQVSSKWTGGGHLRLEPVGPP